MADDPHYASVKLRSTFDGADEATSARDFSPSGHILTFVSDTELDTAQKKFGTASVKFDAVFSGFFIDTFTEGSDTELSVHTPDIGTSWSINTYGGYAGQLTVLGASDKVSPSIDAANDGIAGIANVTYPSADYKVTANAVSIANVAGESFGLIARYVDSSNYYVAFVLTAVGTDIGIFKMVAGVPTDLTSSDLDNDFNTAAHDVRFEVQGTALRLYIDDVLQLSTTDSTYTAAGKAGIAFGTAVDQINDDIDKDWAIDIFFVAEF